MTTSANVESSLPEYASQNTHIRSITFSCHSVKREYDTVVVGGGNAGLCAAMTSARHSRKTLLLEAAPMADRGGNTKYTRDVRYLHGKDKFTSGSYEFDEFLEDIRRVSDNSLDEDMASFVIENSEGIPGWMNENGVKFKREIRGTLNLNRTNAFFIGGGKALANIYYNRLDELGVGVLYSSEVENIIIKDGSFQSLVVGFDGKKVEIGARSLVVCSGGFEANREWLHSIWGNASESFHIRGTKHNKGLPLRSLIAQGALTAGEPKGGHMVAVDRRGPRVDGGIVTRVDAIPLGIVVNKHGKRFYDEGEDIWPKRYAIWGKLVAEQEDQLAYAIVDSTMIGKFMPTAFPPLLSETLDEIPTRIGIDKEGFMDTIQEYNRAAAGKADGSFEARSSASLSPSKSHFYKPIDTPPFMAFPLAPGLTFTYLGLKIGKDARVQTAHGPMENVFAAGEIVSGNVLRSGYLAGFGLTIGTVFGRIAGEEASFV